jgi:hypothetical protein
MVQFKSKSGLIIVVLLLITSFVSGIFVENQYMAFRSDNLHKTEYGVFVPASRSYDYALDAQTKTYDKITNSWYGSSSNPTIFIRINNSDIDAVVMDKISHECNNASKYIDNNECRDELANMYTAIKRDVLKERNYNDGYNKGFYAGANEILNITALSSIDELDKNLSYFYYVQKLNTHFDHRLSKSQTNDIISEIKATIECGTCGKPVYIKCDSNYCWIYYP